MRARPLLVNIWLVLKVQVLSFHDDHQPKGSRRLQPLRGPSAQLLSASLLFLAGCGTTELSATRLLDDDRISLGGDPETQPKPLTPTLTVADGTLRDHCGAPVLLRGVNDLFGWDSPANGLTWIGQIAQTGANAVRVVWRQDRPASDLDPILTSLASEGMLAVVELHVRDETLEEDVAIAAMIDVWTSDAMLSVLSKHARSTVVEFWSGRSSSEASIWQPLHAQALVDLRAAGIVAPIAVRSPTWRNDTAVSVPAQRAVLDADPLSNSMVSFTLWNSDHEVLEEYLRALADAEIPSFISEFSGYRSLTCPEEATEINEVLGLATEYQAGWFAWSWGGVSNLACPTGPLEMTLDGTLDGLFSWGRSVALAHPQGISRTSIPVRSLTLDECP